MKKLMSSGNHKLAPEILVFNLNRSETCPGQTEWCRLHCYDKKSYRYKAVRPARDRNFHFSIGTDFIEMAVCEIKRSNRVQAVRIHGAGDFYNQFYINKWLEIARQLPNIFFKANTRSWMYDFSGKPHNLKLRYSVDPTTKESTITRMLPVVDGIAYIEGCEPEGTFRCNQKCGFSTGRCNFCYTQDGDVSYPIH